MPKKRQDRPEAGSSAGGGGKSLVIVESPAKARTIAKYLGSDFEVESSIGHIRDLPSTADEIPEELKKESWARLGVNVEEGFKPLYIIPKKKQAQVTKLKQKLKHAKALYLATDEDREGEAIAWHLCEVLQPRVPVRRMVFDEITKKAITEAVHQTRDIDQKLVNAQEGRRILDRLYGYEVSPILWRKIGPKLSAGRVQSVATRLVVDRERRRMRFVKAEYWDIEAQLAKAGQGDEKIDARLVELGGKRVALGKDFEETTGRLKGDADKLVWLEAERCQALAERLKKAAFTVGEVAQKPFTDHPHAPFITSTLQQEAGRKLRYTAKRTMQLAQGLYENGYITYMRTDSTSLSQQAVNAARAQVKELYGNEFLPDQPRTYASKSKNAQEAHEAIRPAGEQWSTPKALEGELDPDALRLYELIWKRTVACQMKDATGKRTSVKIDAPAGPDGTAVFTASGKVIEFAGFLRAYVEGSDDPQAELEDQEKILPPLVRGDRLDPLAVEALKHETVPAARYTEASLIKELEDRGIGRPSTYASIIQTIQDRGYVWKKSTALVPTFTAFAVVQLLELHLSALVDYDFTARMEDELDAISNGSQDAAPWLHDFYFGRNGEKASAAGSNGNGDRMLRIGLKRLIGSGQEDIDPRAISAVPIGKTDDGQIVAVRVGRYGPYVQIGDEDRRASLPDDVAPDEMTVRRALELLDKAAAGPKTLGEDPQTGKPVYVKNGRFGPYVQLGDPELTEKGALKKNGKPRMASLWPSMQPETVTLEQALMLLSFPKELGVHPESGEAVTVQDGRYGPYVKMGAESRSLENHEQMASVTLEQALELLKQPKQGGRSRQSSTLAEIGKHPASGAVVHVKSGKYGPYVTDGSVNATLPKGADPASITMEKAVELLKAREEKMRETGQTPRAGRPRSRSGGSVRSAPAAAAAPSELGAPPPGFAWTRTGKPVVEHWPKGKLACFQCGAEMGFKTGWFGPFFGCPKCKAAASLRGEAKKQALAEASSPG